MGTFIIITFVVILRGENMWMAHSKSVLSIFLFFFFGINELVSQSLIEVSALCL